MKYFDIRPIARDFDENTLQQELSGKNELISVDLRGAKISDSALAHLVKTKITDLRVDSELITLDGLRQIQNLKLEHLHIERAQIGDEACDFIVQAWPNLNYLSIAGANISTAGTACLSKLSKLRSLNLRGLQILNDALDHLPAEELQSLDLAETLIDSNCSAKLGRFEQLEYLSLSDTQIDDRGIDKLEEISKLNYLSLAGTAITDECLTNLPSNLFYLRLDRTEITIQGLRAASSAGKLSSLKQLGICKCPALKGSNVHEGMSLVSDVQSLFPGYLFWAPSSSV